DNVQLHRDPPPLARAVSDRPCSSAVARRQALDSLRVTNLRHSATDLGDERLRRCLVLADGTRTPEQLARAVSEGDGGDGAAGEVTVAEAEHCLRDMAVRALLTA